MRAYSIASTHHKPHNTMPKFVGMASSFTRRADGASHAKTVISFMSAQSPQSFNVSLHDSVTCFVFDPRSRGAVRAERITARRRMRQAHRVDACAMDEAQRDEGACARQLVSCCIMAVFALQAQRLPRVGVHFIDGPKISFPNKII